MLMLTNFRLLLDSQCLQLHIVIPEFQNKYKLNEERNEYPQRISLTKHLITDYNMITGYLNVSVESVWLKLLCSSNTCLQAVFSCSR